MKRRLPLCLGFTAVLAVLFFSGIALAEDLYSPYPPDAPWPVMRGDLHNTGYGRFMEFKPEEGAPQEPVHFRTGNGIFSTPVIDGNEIIYVGSADHYFYALDPQTKTVLWKFDAKELIDSAAALGKDGRVYVPAGGALYALDRQGNQKWSFDVTNNRPADLYTFGTNYWWEGNVVVGPEGDPYAGNDDFFFYRINPDGTMRWAYRTGFLIWSVPAFDARDTMFFSGFDMRLYALDKDSGKMKWKKNLKNPLVASPALGPDGTIYQGSFDGNLYALEPTHGKILWTLKTDSHVYASAAVDKNGNVFVASTDGFIYAADGQSGRVKWTFYTGDAIRSSPVLGPDPEKRSAYLIYFGGGQGDFFALDERGNRRWSFDTLSLAGRVEYPNLNASPALGRRGVAMANANGDVFYVPYDYYLRPNAAGINLDPSEGFREQGPAWHWVSPGGLIDKESLNTSAAARSIHAGQVIILRLAVVENGRIARASLDPKSVTVTAAPSFAHRLEVVGDDRTVLVVPEEMIEPGKDYSLKVRARYLSNNGNSGQVEGTVKLHVKETGRERPMLKSDHAGFVITQMAFPQPPIIPSMDQIGIAIMKIPFSIVQIDRDKNTLVAWAVQKYGAGTGGEEQGVPDSRSLFYAFSGQVKGEYFIIESENCFFEESSFPFPFDRFRLSGRIAQDGAMDADASLFAELDPPAMLKALGQLSVSSEEDKSGQKSWLGGALGGGGIKGFIEAALVSGPAVAGYISHHVWRPWDLYNYQGRFVTAGTFRMKAMPAEEMARPKGIELKSFTYNASKKELTAEAAVTDKEARQVMLAILLVDNETGKPVPINYNLALRRQRLADGTKRTTLKVPDKKLHRGDLTAYAMADLYPLDKMQLP